MAKIEEEVHGLRESLDKQQEVMDVIARDFSRFTVWAASGISQLLDLSGATYTRYSETHVPYQRRMVRQRTNGAELSTKYSALGTHLEEIHMTWAHLEKDNRTRLRDLHLKKFYYMLETASQHYTWMPSQPILDWRKGFWHNSIKNNLRKFKGKDIVDNAAQASNATTIAPGMYKLDPVTLAPKDKNNRETHIYFLKHTMEQAAILREIVEQSKSLNPLDSASYSACKYVKLIQELLGYVRETCPDIDKPSEKLVAVTPINKKETVSSMFDARHELCFLEFVSGRTFTLVGNVIPLSRITATNKVPLREPIPLKHMTEDRSQLTNFVHKFLGTVKFSNDHIAKIIRNIRTYNDTEFVNQTLRDYYEQVGISHETSVTRTPQQNGVVERRNRTFVEVARTMLIFVQAPLFLWAKLTAMASEQLGSRPELQCMTPATSSLGLVPNPIPQQPCIPPLRDDLDRLFQPMFDEYFNPPTIGVSPVLVVVVARAVDLAESPVSMSIDQDAPSTSTDISKITRNQSKTGKHGQENQKSTKEAKERKSIQKPEAKPGKVKPSVKVVKSWSTKVNH
ncbi:integrase, catalytic region, zinc finger, CCHC-type containing protein [Tanacetum coccineum]